MQLAVSFVKRNRAKMIKSIKIDNDYLEVVIKSVRRSRNIRILVYSNGKIVVTKPFYVSMKKALDFISERETWIKASLQKYNLSFPLKVEDRQLEEKNHFKKHAKEARKKISARLEEINSLYNFTYHRVSIRNQKTRWGSCSRDGNLNFNYRLILLKPEFLDYVITHELCHLQEFNHSPDFWRLVAKVCPDYKRIRKELKAENLLKGQ